MNQTQGLIISATFGAVLSFPTAESIFLEEIMPILLKTAPYGVLLSITFLYFILAVIVFVASLGIYFKITKNIIWSSKNLSGNKFNKFMIKNIFIFFISLILAIIIRVNYF